MSFESDVESIRDIVSYNQVERVPRSSTTSRFKEIVVVEVENPLKRTFSVSE